MKVTIRVNDRLWVRARRRAVAERRSVASLVEEGLEYVLAERASNPCRVTLPVSRETGGLRPGVDLGSSGSLEELMGGNW